MSPPSPPPIPQPLLLPLDFSLHPFLLLFLQAHPRALPLHGGSLHLYPFPLATSPSSSPFSSSFSSPPHPPPSSPPMSPPPLWWLPSPSSLTGDPSSLVSPPPSPPHCPPPLSPFELSRFIVTPSIPFSHRQPLFPPLLPRHPIFLFVVLLFQACLYALPLHGDSFHLHPFLAANLSFLVLPFLLILFFSSSSSSSNSTYDPSPSAMAPSTFVHLLSATLPFLFSSSFSSPSPP